MITRGLRGSAPIVLGLVLLGTGGAFADDAPSNPRPWLLQISGGVSSMGLGDVKDFYASTKQFYEQGGLTLETQREFPPNLIFGADLLYHQSGFRFGAGTRYTWTHAYTLYGDNSGNLDLVMEMRLLAVQLVVQKEWPRAGWSPLLEARVGQGLVWIEASETVELTAVAATLETTLEGDGHGPLAELHAGAYREIGAYVLSATAGYRYCNVPGPPFDLDVSGFVVSLNLGWSF